jgi:ligand-binding sensor domain-containing protein/signal transduction histidine kinase
MLPSSFGRICARLRMRRSLTGLVVVVCLFAFDGRAGDYLLRTWQTDDGLPQNSVQSIHQTSDGYLWVGTQDGLARFDGLHFTTFNPATTPEMPGRWFSSLLQSRDGAFWIGTDGKGLVCVSNGEVSHFHRNNGLVSDSVRTIFQTRDDSILIGTGGGLSRFRDGKFSNYTTQHGLGHPVVRGICETSNGDLWVATGNALHRFEAGEFSAGEMFDVGNGLPSNSLRCLLADKSGVLWIGSNGGLTRYKDGAFTTFTQKDGLLDSTVSALCLDSKGNLWVGTYGGLHRLIEGKLVPESTDSGAIFDAVYSIFEDCEGNIWVGTNAGLLRLKERRFHALTKQNGLSHNSTVSVLQDKSGSMWIGTWGGALNEFRDGIITIHSASEVIPFHFMLGLHQSRDGALWFGTDYDGGLYRRELDGGIRRWGKEHGLVEPAIAVIHEDRSGNIWIGTRTALVRLNEDRLKDFTTRDGLPANSITAIAEDRAGDLWIGTAGGLAVLRDGVFEKFGEAQGLTNTPVLALREVSEGGLWIGTKGKGLHAWRSGEWKSYTTEDGLFHDDVFEILEHDGSLWMTCSRGVFRVSKQDLAAFDRGESKRLHCVSYDKSDGMVSVDCKGVARPAAWKANDGSLWFATGKGVVIARPDIRVNRRPPPVYVEGIWFDKRPLHRSSIASSGPTALSIPPGNGDLEIRYTALSLQAPEKNRFKYQLEGVDSDWVDAGMRRIAYYNNVPPGEYRFKVIASNNDALWNDTGAQINLTLQPHFWQTWWSQAGIVLVSVGVLFGAYRIRISRLHEIERLRVRIAGDLHDEVGSSLWSISLLSRMLQKSETVTGESKRDAEEINRIAVQTANSIRDIVWFINPEYDTTQDLFLRMRDVASTMLGEIDFRLQLPQENLSRKLPLDFRQNVFLMFKEILANTVKHSKATCVQIEVSETQDVWQMVVRDNGVGFNMTDRASGNGLKNLHRRAEKLNGTLEIKSQPGVGTSIWFAMKSFK